MTPQVQIEFTESPLTTLIGEIVGFVKVNVPWVHSEDSCEHKVNAGIYPVYLGKNESREIVFVSHINAVRESGNTYKVTKHFDIVGAIERTAISPGQNFDICISPFIWSDLINVAKQNLEAYQTVINKYYDAYLKQSNVKYCNNLHMIGYCSKRISDAVSTIESISKKKEFVEQATDLLNQIHGENISLFFA
jgi:hypothetical protein